MFTFKNFFSLKFHNLKLCKSGSVIVVWMVEWSVNDQLETNWKELVVK